ncbi:MAG: phospho-N-acetylmuramoyl-pentapeptide-transferase, partial [Lactobacillus iners]|nr:phospho-N-acetylmuramoyl-pentapeptide-transferase [Lactobacillus iners]
WLIVFMHMHHEGQPIREEGPKAHLKKAGTPTMGGTVFVIASIIASVSVLVWKQSFNNIAIILIIALLGHGLIGFLDDGLKIIWKNNLGLRAWQKLLLQILIAVVLVLISSFDHFGFALRM